MKQRIMVFLAAILLMGCSSARTIDALTVHILKVGKADAIIVHYNGQTLLIDSGEEDDGEKVMTFLKAQGIDEVSVMIITHFDKDHVGGADIVLEQIPVKQVFAPDYEGAGSDYEEFLEALEKTRVPLIRLREDETLHLGDVRVCIEPPMSYDIPTGVKEYDNNFSLITTIIHGENRLIFTGDIEKKRIREWLQTNPEPCDFLKWPHHGIYHVALHELLQTLKPQYVAICDSQKNPADIMTIELIKRYTPEVYETKNGNISVISDGKRLEIRHK